MENVNKSSGPPTYIDVEEVEQKYLKKKFNLFNDGAIRVGPGGYILSKVYAEFAEKFYNYDFRSDDIVIMTYPKSGTTWMQEIVWTMMCNPNLDNPSGNIAIDSRSLNFEVDLYLNMRGGVTIDEDSEFMAGIKTYCPGTDIKDGVILKLLDISPSPRVIKTHLPFSFHKESMVEKCKVIYLLRDIVDVIPSYEHYSRMQKAFGYNGTLREFADIMMKGLNMFSPYFPHVKEAWQKRHHPNVLLVFYEDFIKNSPKEISKLNDFLKTDLTSEQIENIAEYTSFETMKKRMANNPPTSDNHALHDEKVVKEEGGFFRKGVIGSGKKELPPDVLQKVLEWKTENMKDFDDDFKYKIQ